MPRSGNESFVQRALLDAPISNEFATQQKKSSYLFYGTLLAYCIKMTIWLCLCGISSRYLKVVQVHI
uniref:Uncharacterized protein n=1 Tax=Triticum urartu TaxID=4572 RepID=A0A8R7U720_TRIUA